MSFVSLTNSGGTLNLPPTNLQELPVCTEVPTQDDQLTNKLYVDTIDLSLSTALSTEVSDRISGDASLSTALSTEISYRISAAPSFSTALSTETSQRVSGDLSLSTALSTETSQRVSGDTSLSTIIQNLIGTTTPSALDTLSEIAAALSNDPSFIFNLSSSLSIETVDRISGDVSLSTAISTEVSNRISGDVSLSTALSTETVDRIAVDTSLSTALSTETVDRIAVDESLSTALSTETVDRIAVDESLSTVVSIGDTTYNNIFSSSGIASYTAGVGGAPLNITTRSGIITCTFYSITNTGSFIIQSPSGFITANSMIQLTYRVGSVAVYDTIVGVDSVSAGTAVIRVYSATGFTSGNTVKIYYTIYP